MITPPIKIRKLPNFPKRVQPFFDGYRFDCKYFSTDYRTVLDHATSEFPESNGCDLYSIKMQVFSSAFSQDDFSRDAIRVHESVLRVAGLELKMLPICFQLYFDADSRGVKSTFYFLGYNKLGEGASIRSVFPSDLIKTLHQKIKERVGSHFSFSFKKSKLQTATPTENVDLPLVKIPNLLNSALNVALFDFLALFGSQEYRGAVGRAIRGLPLNKAQKFTSTINTLIDLNADKSIMKFHAVTKAPLISKENVQCVNQRTSDDFLAQLGLDDL